MTEHQADTKSDWIAEFLRAFPEMAESKQFLEKFHQMCVHIRSELAVILQLRFPSAELIGEREGNLIVRKDGRECVWQLDELYSTVALLPTTRKDERVKIFLESAIRLLGDPAPESISMAEHGRKLRPMLVKPEFLQMHNVPHIPMSSLGLVVIYCIHQHMGLDFNCIVSEEMPSALGITIEKIHELSLTNLEQEFPAEALKKPLEAEESSALQRGDSFDAARLLIIPRMLKSGQSLLAVIPHRDVLLLLPRSTDLSKLGPGIQQLRCDQHQPLLEQPVLVKSDGFETLVYKV